MFVNVGTGRKPPADSCRVAAGQTGRIGSKALTAENSLGLWEDAPDIAMARDQPIAQISAIQDGCGRPRCAEVRIWVGKIGVAKWVKGSKLLLEVGGTVSFLARACVLSSVSHATSSLLHSVSMSYSDVRTALETIVTSCRSLRSPGSTCLDTNTPSSSIITR